jgi:hypothetical protein
MLCNAKVVAAVICENLQALSVLLLLLLHVELRAC